MSEEKSLLEYWELKNVKETAFNDGRLEEKLSIAKVLKNQGVSLEVIMNSTGLTANEIEAL